MWREEDGVEGCGVNAQVLLDWLVRVEELMLEDTSLFRGSTQEECCFCGWLFSEVMDGIDVLRSIPKEDGKLHTMKVVGVSRWNEGFEGSDYKPWKRVGFWVERSALA